MIMDLLSSKPGLNEIDRDDSSIQSCDGRGYCFHVTRHGVGERRTEANHPLLGLWFWLYTDGGVYVPQVGDVVNNLCDCHSNTIPGVVYSGRSYRKNVLINGCLFIVLELLTGFGIASCIRMSGLINGE